MDINKIINSQSSRHHYIPQFFLKGFKNEEGLLYVYDKKKNKILSDPRPAKSIFFEKNRNTVQITENRETSIIEDIYSNIDFESSKVISYYRDEDLDKIKFSTEDTAKIKFFLITLFWRIPYTDFTAKDLISRAELHSEILEPERIKSDQTFLKFQRAMFFKKVVDEMKDNALKGKVYINIHESSTNIYLIGDNPVLYRKTPGTFNELGELDFLIAIGPRRVYSSTSNSLENFKFENSIRYNTSVIHQSVNYVASNDLEVLRKAIMLYNELKEKNALYRINERTFETK